MKHLNHLGWKLLTSLAAALILTAEGSAQGGLFHGGGQGGATGGNLANDIRDGHGPHQAPRPEVFAGSIRVDPSPSGNLGNDIREAPDSGPQFVGSVLVDLQPEASGELVLGWEVTQLPDSDLGALIPTRRDMRNKLRLSGGTPGLGLISVELSSGSDHHGQRHVLWTGAFDQAGILEVEVPANLDPAGLRARAAELAGGVIVRQVEVELGGAAEEAYASWQLLSRVARPQGALHGIARAGARQSAAVKPIR